MKKATIKDLEPLGNENSYTTEFFEELYEKIGLTDQTAQIHLKKRIISAANKYLEYYSCYEAELPPHTVKKELRKALVHINKAKKSLNNLHQSGNYDREVGRALYEVISEKHPLLHSLIGEVHKPSFFEQPPLHSYFSIVLFEKSMTLLSAITDGIEHAIQDHKFRKTTTKSKALNVWLTTFSEQLENAIGHILEQSRYHNGEYISKRKVGDSELLLFIIEPLDRNVTISQLETAIKETRKERHEKHNIHGYYLLKHWFRAA